METNLERGEVVWVDFGNPRGSEPAGVLPALVIQNDVGNRFSPNTIVCAITRTIKTYPVDVVVETSESGLQHRSNVNCSLILTVTQDRIISRSRKLPPERLEDVDKALKISVGLL